MTKIIRIRIRRRTERCQQGQPIINIHYMPATGQRKIKSYFPKFLKRFIPNFL